ncbi:hypothetical protein D3C72_2438850 [compost metagenome]
MLAEPSRRYANCFTPAQERVWRLGDIACRETMLDSERKFMDHFGSVRSDDSRTKDDALFISNNLDESVAEV